MNDRIAAVDALSAVDSDRAHRLDRSLELVVADRLGLDRQVRALGRELRGPDGEVERSRRARLHRDRQLLAGAGAARRRVLAACADPLAGELPDREARGLPA